MGAMAASMPGAAGSRAVDRDMRRPSPRASTGWTPRLIYELEHSEEVIGAAIAGPPADERPYVCSKCGPCWGFGPTYRSAAARCPLDPVGGRGICVGCGCHSWTCCRSAGCRCGPALDEYWQVMVDLKATGSVPVIGLSNHDVAQVDAAEVGGGQPRRSSDNGCGGRSPVRFS